MWSSWGENPSIIATEGTPHEECQKECKEIYDAYWPGVSGGACDSQCETGKFTAFKSTCNVDTFLDLFGFETKEACLKFWDDRESP